MNILDFNGKKEITCTSAELNNLDQTWNFFVDGKAAEVLCECEIADSGESFSDGIYELTRPDHVSNCNPSLNDLVIIKIS